MPAHSRFFFTHPVDISKSLNNAAFFILQPYEVFDSNRGYWKQMKK